MGTLRVSPKQLEALQNVARTFTAWVIDTGRAIKSGDLDDRAAALEQATTLVEVFDNTNIEEE